MVKCGQMEIWNRDTTQYEGITVIPSYCGHRTAQDTNLVVGTCSDKSSKDN